MKNITKLPKWYSGEEVDDLVKWLDERTLEEVRSWRAQYDGVIECKHPGCCCVCGHTKRCPEDGPSLIEGIHD